MSFDIVWTSAFKWWEKPLGYYRLLKARKNFGTRIRLGNPFTDGHLLCRAPGYQEKLRRLTNIHEGRRCFIMGNGPSLRKMDLSPLKNEITIGSNGIYKLFPRMGFHTTYLTMEDIAQCEDRRSDTKHIKGPIKIFALHNAYCVPPDDTTLFMNVYLHQDGEQKFSEDCSTIVYLGSTITYINLQLAFHLGCNPVYLIGVDFNYGPIEKKLDPGRITVTKEVLKDISQSHFDPQYHRVGSRFGIPHSDKQYRAFLKARSVYEACGRRIINAGVNSRLDVFEKVEFADLFDKNQTCADDRLALFERLSSTDEVVALINPKGTGSKWKRLYDRAAESYEKGRYMRAMRYLEGSMAAKANMPAYYLTACVKKALGDIIGASKIFTQIISYEGRHLDKTIFFGAHYHLGEMDYRQRNLLEAQYHLKHCLNIAAFHSRAHDYLERMRLECEAESAIVSGMEITRK